MLSKLFKKKFRAKPNEDYINKKIIKSKGNKEYTLRMTDIKNPIQIKIITYTKGPIKTPFFEGDEQIKIHYEWNNTESKIIKKQRDLYVVDTNTFYDESEKIKCENKNEIYKSPELIILKNKEKEQSNLTQLLEQAENTNQTTNSVKEMKTTDLINLYESLFNHYKKITLKEFS